MIVETVTKARFRDRFCDMGRSDNFSHEGLGALYDYLWDLSESCGVPMELDVITICCEYSEYDSVEALADSYGVEVHDVHDIGHLIRFPSGVILEHVG